MYHPASRAPRESRTTHACALFATPPCDDEEIRRVSDTTTETPVTTAAASEQARDRYGKFGGRYVPETLIPAIEALDSAFDEARLSDRVGTRVYLKREDLNHTGAHKINNTVGQVLLARRMGKTRIIAETGAGQ